ncbi:DUF2934 domain-containing protein [methanotrophic endosymbiont of Bathymodiolus puteoserpentis (Logatchev)]|jgi:hypothetical protein|uniref:DUF2934 domain-containing protein n=1 Tax=methanotrophic endosymbiont of Bathymodiolus puteoserpentis (Logatchev) TaxID=343235 RepID=UPI0013C843A3|nr:DUF2934 domain-containing protein [methanotrophic endosymbiont of Bathymodiolus puteoserpentis (Logatchev)]SHE19760.1 hypothetical protein BPUTEOMOX_2661 [methanotrophic endosymbiont of Bathymodiolus puteoserpentis (Logatchev)]
MPKPEDTACQINPDDLIRHQWVSVAAYFRAEASGFEPGKNLDNWLEAEIEYIEFQIQGFLQCAQEDGGMSIVSLQKLAQSIGVAHAGKFSSELELIRKIQKATRHRSCFRTLYQQPCEEPESECPWRAECQKICAVWYR